MSPAPVPAPALFILLGDNGLGVWSLLLLLLLLLTVDRDLFNNNRLSPPGAANLCRIFLPSLLPPPIDSLPESTVPSSESTEPLRSLLLPILLPLPRLVLVILLLLFIPIPIPLELFLTNICLDSDLSMSAP